jgi:hypothetical protein
MITNNILVKEQYGFRNNISTEKAIYQLTNNILNALDNKYLVGGIFCIILGGNSAGSDKVFKLQKRAIRLLQILIAVLHVVTYLKN